jgi:hemerythrin-like domain-containing protein
MAYCRTYPDQFHHPKEDLIYRAICSHDPRATPAIDDLEAEHEELAIASQEFADLVEQGLATGARPTAFNEIALAFVAQYRQHIAKEDREFFPSAVEMLSQEEWRELSDQIDHPGDPLFYQTAADRLQALLARKFEKAG